MRIWMLRISLFAVLALAGCSSQDCAPGESRQCYSGPSGTDGVGACTHGFATCSADGEWSSCEGQRLPGDEICDGLDNNCNGEVDEGLRNACGGCATLEAEPLSPCNEGGERCSAWLCEGTERVRCHAAAEVMSKGCTNVDGCGGTYACNAGKVVCSAAAKNECGLCGGRSLDGKKGSSCTGPNGCPGVMVCNENGDALSCSEQRVNNCGKCGQPDVAKVGATCTVEARDLPSGTSAEDLEKVVGCQGHYVCNADGSGVTCETNLRRNDCNLCVAEGVGVIPEAQKPTQHCTSTDGCEGKYVCDSSGLKTVCSAPVRNQCGKCGGASLPDLGKPCLLLSASVPLGEPDYEVLSSCSDAGLSGVKGEPCCGTLRCDTELFDPPLSGTHDGGSLVCSVKVTSQKDKGKLRKPLFNNCGYCGAGDLVGSAPASGYKGSDDTGKLLGANCDYGNPMTNYPSGVVLCASEMVCPPTDTYTGLICQQIPANPCGYCGQNAYTGSAPKSPCSMSLTSEVTGASVSCGGAGTKMRALCDTSRLATSCTYDTNNNNTGSESPVRDSEDRAPWLNNCDECNEPDRVFPSGAPVDAKVGDTCIDPVYGCTGKYACEQTSTVSPTNPTQNVKQVVCKAEVNECDGCQPIEPTVAVGVPCQPAGCEGNISIYDCDPVTKMTSCQPVMRNQCGTCVTDGIELGHPLDEPCCVGYSSTPGQLAPADAAQCMARGGCSGSYQCMPGGLEMYCTASRNNCGQCNAPDVDGLKAICELPNGCLSENVCDSTGTSVVCKEVSKNGCGLCGGPDLSAALGISCGGGKSYSCTPDGASTYCPNNQATDLVISQFGVKSGTNGGFFVELYNPTNVSLTPNTYMIKLGTGPDITVSAGALAPRSYWLIGLVGTELVPLDQEVLGTVSSASGSIVLKRGATEIDNLVWGSAGANIGAPIDNPRMRKAFDSSSDEQMAPGGVHARYGNGYKSGVPGQDFVSPKNSTPRSSSSAPALTWP